MADFRTFIAKYRAAAEEVSRETGIPVERILAQAGHETGWNLTPPGNNFFGIKAQPGYSGKSQTLGTTEDYGKGLVKTREPFRVYENPADSFRDWAKLIATDRYSAALQPGIPDAEYAQALKDGGYATDPKYAQKLTSVIDMTRSVLGAQPPEIEGDRGGGLSPLPPSVTVASASDWAPSTGALGPAIEGDMGGDPAAKLTKPKPPASLLAADPGYGVSRFGQGLMSMGAPAPAMAPPRIDMPVMSPIAAAPSYRPQGGLLDLNPFRRRKGGGLLG